jgi:hypothetical protein
VKQLNMTHIQKLLSISSEPLAAKPQGESKLLETYALGPELFRLLSEKNGFYAFESALHVFPLTSDPVAGIGLEEWNSQSLWRSAYEGLADGLLFFAEDIFQDQFCLSRDEIARFRAETGETTFMADSIESWASLILSDYKRETAWPLASKWQSENGVLAPGKRLMPKTPFFLGGAYSLGNLWVGDPVEGMRFKADLATQTRNVQDGTKVKLHLSKRPEES